MSRTFRNISDQRFLRWVKSSASGGSDGCLYVSPAEDGSGDVAIADSKEGQDGPIQVYSRGEWIAFLVGVKRGDFDLV